MAARHSHHYGCPVASDLTSPSWWSVTVRSDPGSAELVADVLWSFDPPAVEERDITDQGRSLVLCGFDDRDTANRAALAVQELPRCEAWVSAVTDDGLDAWRAHAEIARAGPFVVVPAWLDHLAAPGEVVVRLDPGRTFGSGSHPTTRLTLEQAAPLLGAEVRVLDVGSGSGVLSIAAALSGAEVVALDIDPEALETTRVNAADNGVADRVTVDPRHLADVVADPASGKFDVVLANLLAPVVRELAPYLSLALAPGGHLIVSGLLEDRWWDAVDPLTGSDRRLEVADVGSRDGWVAVVLGPTGGLAPP